MSQKQKGKEEQEANSGPHNQQQLEPCRALVDAPIRLATLSGCASTTVIVHAGVVHNYHLEEISPRLNEAEIQEKISGFVEDINDRSESSAVSGIATGFSGKINEPRGTEAQNVAPVLVKSNFFHGDALLDEVNYSVADERGRKKIRKRAREAQVFLPELHNYGRYIILVGGAGSGKTTLIKRYCCMVLNKEIMEEIKMIHFINIRDLSKEALTPREMLFEKFLLGEHKKDGIKYGYEWMQKEENQSSILLAFDGIDTAPWTLSDETHDLISYDDKRPAETIVYNILYGHLFPKCKILLTSREYGITGFPVTIQPESVIALKGFTRESIRILVMDLGGDKGDEIWNKLTQKSVNLMLLCSTPIFLIFAIVVYKSHDNPPENLSGIIITLVESHIRSRHRRISNDKVREMLKKLKALSLYGLERGKVVFTVEEFHDHGLDIKDVKDLVIGVPTPDADVACDQNLLEEDYSYFFCHQAVQEALAAMQVAGLEMENFTKFTKQHVHVPKYGVVRQILCGVLYNDETTKLAQKQRTEVANIEEKQCLVLNTLKEELVKSKDSPMDMLNMLISLRECGGRNSIVEMVKENLSMISLSGIPLTPSDLHAAARVARHCDKLSIMQLVNCHLDKNSLGVLAEGLKGSNVEITVFDVSFNGNLRKDSMFDLHEICIRGQGLNYWQCGFRQSDILMFNEREAQTQSTTEIALPSTEDVIKRAYTEDSVLDLDSYYVENHFDVLERLVTQKEKKENEKVRANLVEYETGTDVTRLCDILRCCDNVGEFALSESEFSEAQLKTIGEAIEKKKIDSLNVFLNPDIQANGWGALGTIAKTCMTKNLFITACTLTEVKLKSFKFSLKGCQIYKLDVSRNDDMDQYCLREVGDIVQTCGVQELVMGYCNFSAEHMKYLKRSVSGGKINRIDMSGNDNMGPEGYYALGEMVCKCEVKLLDVSECDPSSEEMANFKSGADVAKITKLNVSRNRRMGTGGLKSVGQLVGQCELDELFVRQCELEEHTLRSFQQGLGEAKIRHLDLGFYFMKVRPTTDVELGILEDILPHVTEQLTINDWDISEKGRRSLQQTLDGLPFIVRIASLIGSDFPGPFLREFHHKAQRCTLLTRLICKSRIHRKLLIRFRNRLLPDIMLSIATHSFLFIANSKKSHIMGIIMRKYKK